MTEDEKIAALFADHQRSPDEAFVARIARAVEAERRMAAMRAAAWRRFAVECVASVAVVASFWLVWRLAPASLPTGAIATAPAAAAAVLTLGLWFGVVLRPAATGK
ncbi:MAG TPA: hypothetical protein VEW04_06985 [Allosphingosinicella sp.]|nr:hypothetical protein [Allosphingosinicella sp.]